MTSGGRAEGERVKQGEVPISASSPSFETRKQGIFVRRVKG
jgi:hypothetical protein